MRSLTQKTKIWWHNAVSRRFGKYSFSQLYEKKSSKRFDPIVYIYVYFLRAVAHSQYVIFPCFCLSLSEQASNLERSFVRQGKLHFLPQFLFSKRNFPNLWFWSWSQDIHSFKKWKKDPFLTTFNCYIACKNQTNFYVNKMERKKCKNQMEFYVNM